MEFLLLMFLAVFGLGVYVPVACIRRYLRNVRGAELYTPLLRSSVDHRVAAIVREAESGASECGVCGFANSKRSSSCALCGSALGAFAADATSKRATAWKSVNKKTRSLIEIVTVPLDQRPPVVAALTKRQLRAKKRNEWTRALDASKATAKESLVWCRDELQGAVDLRFPGFVLHFQHERQESTRRPRRRVLSEESIDIDNDLVFGTVSSTRQSSGSSVRSASGPSHDAAGNEELRATPMDARLSCRPEAAAHRAKMATEQRLQELLEATAGISVKVIDASVVDATRFPLEQQPVPSPSFASELEPCEQPHWDALLGISTQPFPTKYAHFVTATSALLVPPKKELIRFHVSRVTLFADSVEALSAIPESSIRSRMRVQFLDEPGVDAGGLHREWFALFTQALVDPANGVFRCVNEHDHSFYVDRVASDDDGHMLLAHFAAGRLIGRALLEGHVLGFHLALPLLKIILGIPVSFSDLEHFDPGLFKSLLWMLNHDGVDGLGLDFSVLERSATHADREVVVTDLIRNGHKIEVTDDNKDFYVERRFHYLLFESVAAPLYAFLKGVYEVVPQELLMLLDPEELDYVLCGSDTIDVDDWQRHTKYSDNLVAHPARDWFWESVRAMRHDHRRKLLQFATGSSRVPIAGFRALTSSDGKLCPFTLNGIPATGLHAGRSRGYVRSHACFNQLDLPLHDTRHEFRAALLAAIESGDVYGFTTS